MGSFEVFEATPLYLRINPREVGWDTICIGKGDDIMSTGVSTCLAVSLYHPKTTHGMVAHVCGFKDGQSPEHMQPGRAVGTMLEAFEKATPFNLGDLEATFAGEIGMLGLRKSNMVRSRLGAYGIPIIGEDVGEKYGRDIFLWCGTGDVAVYKKEIEGIKVS